MDRYSNRMKSIIIEYFINNLVDYEEVKLKLLYYLSTSEGKELLISSTKYFGKVFDDLEPSHEEPIVVLEPLEGGSP